MVCLAVLFAVDAHLIVRIYIEREAGTVCLGIAGAGAENVFFIVETVV